MLLLLSHIGHVRLFKIPWPVLPVSSVQGILQARILKWFAMLSSRGYWPRDQTHSSYVSGIGSWILYTSINRASLEAQLVKNCQQCRRPRFHSWVRKMPWRRERVTTPVLLGFPGGSDRATWEKESASNVGYLGLTPGLGRSPGEGNSYPL